MTPYAELLEFNQPNPIRLEGFTRIRDKFGGLDSKIAVYPENETDPLDNTFYAAPERIMEFAGRWDYGEKNAKKLGETVKIRVPIDQVRPGTVPFGQGYVEEEVPIIQKYLEMGHESMIEMGDATFFIECSRVVSHELVRHRIASYQQESQRFVKYDEYHKDDFYFPDGMEEVEAIEAELHDDGSECDPAVSAAESMEAAYSVAFGAYMNLREAGVAPQLARYVLPNSFRTRMVMKTNIREWRHVLQLRLDKSAQPEMRELMVQIYDQLVMVFPNALHGAIDNGRGIR